MATNREEMYQHFSHVHWIKEIGQYIGRDEGTEQDCNDIIRFALSYTLQSLRANEDMLRFRWKGDENNMG